MEGVVRSSKFIVIFITLLLGTSLQQRYSTDIPKGGSVTQQRYSTDSPKGGSVTQQPYTKDSTGQNTYPPQTPSPVQPCPDQECPRECALARTMTTCDQYYLKDGQLNEQELNRFIQDRKAMTRVKNLYQQLNQAGVLDERMLTCEGLKLLLTSLWRVRPGSVDNLINFVTGNMTSDPVTAIDSIPEIFFNFILIQKAYTNVKSTQKCCNDEQTQCLCHISFRLGCLNRVVLQNYTCTPAMHCDKPSTCRRVRVNEREMQKYCLDYKESKKPMKQWSTSDWTQILDDSLDTMLENKQMMDLVPKDVFLQRLQQFSCNNLDKLHKNLALNKLQSLLKQADFRTQNQQLQKTVIELVGECGGDYLSLEKYVTDKSLLVETFDANAVKKTRQLVEMRKSLETLKPDIANYTKEDIVKYIKLFINKPDQLAEFSDTALSDAVPEISHLDLTQGQLRKLYTRVKAISRFSNPANYTEADVIELGNMISILPLQELTQISSTALGSALATGTLINVTWSRGMFKQVFEKYKDHLAKDLTADDLLLLGDLSVYLGPAEWREISANEIVEFLNDSNTMERIHRLSKFVGKGVQAMIAEKVKLVPGADEVLNNYESFRKLASGRMSSTEIDDVAAKLESGEAVNMEFTRTQCKRTLEKMKEHLGPMEAWTTENFETLKSSNLIGCISAHDLETAIKNNPNGLLIMSYVGTSTTANERMKEKMVKTVRNQLKDASAENVAAMKDQLIENPQVLVRLKEDMLQKLECEDVISSLQGIDLLTVPCTRLQDKMDFYLQCKNATADMEISDTALEDAGSILCAMNPDHIDRMTAKALTYYSPDLAKCQCQNLENKDAKLRALQQKGVIPASADQFTDEHLAILGDDFLYLPETYIEQTPTSVLEPYLSILLENYSVQEKQLADRRKKGFRNDRTAAERRKIQARIETFKKRAIEIILASRAGRRKRSADGMKCSQMQTLQTALSVITVNDIAAIETSEFINCASLLGSDLGFSKDQITALAAKAKEAWGADTSSWTESNIYNAGRILQGLSSTELQSLNLTINHIYNMGSMDGWDHTQKETLFQQFMTIAKHADESAISATELNALGHILCGIDASDISSIASYTYGDVAETVGDLTNCSEEQLEAFASLAKGFFGSDVTTWDEATVSEVGIVMGGLPTTDIAKLTETQISAIDAGDIIYIPIKQFSSFTTTQFGYFSSAQAQAISMKQYKSLNSQQRTAIETQAEMKFTTAETVSGSPTHIYTSCLWLVLLVTVFYF